MHENEKIAAVGRVATGLHAALAAEFQSPMGGVEVGSQWYGEDFNRIVLATPAGELFVTVTSAVGEEGADVRVVVLDSETFESGAPLCGAHARELGRVARAVAEIPGVCGVWADAMWSGTFFASVRPEGVDS